MLNALRAVASMYHLALKFSTPIEVGVIHRNQVEARRCYSLTLKGPPNAYQKANIISNSSSASSFDIRDLRSSLPNNFTLASSLASEVPALAMLNLVSINTDSIELHRQPGGASRRQQRARTMLQPDQKQSKRQRGSEESHDTLISEKGKVDVLKALGEP